MIGDNVLKYVSKDSSVWFFDEHFLSDQSIKFPIGNVSNQLQKEEDRMGRGIKSPRTKSPLSQYELR